MQRSNKAFWILFDMTQVRSTWPYSGVLSPGQRACDLVYSICTCICTCIINEANLVCRYRKNTQNSSKLSNNERNIEKVMEISQKRRNILATTSLYPLQLLNYDRDAATDPSLQNNADPSPFSFPGRKKVDKHFDCSKIL